jgi:hypothetical protein
MALNGLSAHLYRIMDELPVIQDPSANGGCRSTLCHRSLPSDEAGEPQITSRPLTKSIVGEFTESIWLVFGVGRPGVRRKQHGRAHAVLIAPLDGLHDEFLVVGAASASQKEVGPAHALQRF